MNNNNPFRGDSDSNKVEIPPLLDLDISDYFHEVGESLSGQIDKGQSFEFLEHFPLFDSQAMYVSNLINEPKIFYQRGIEKLFGYSKEEFNTKLVMNWFHPKQADLVQRIIQGIVYYGLSLSKYDKGDQSLMLYVKVRKKDGSYLPILRQTNFYGQDGDGRRIGAISIITDLSGLTFPDRVEWKIRGSNVNEERFREYITNSLSKLFSKREKEILKLIDRRKTSMEIGKKLFISKNTVDTHRRNMLKKADVANSYDLVQFAKANSLL